MKLIPAIDVLGGKCVRLTKGDYNQKKVYDDNPIDVARQLEDQGFKYLHLVDLDGARSSSPKNLYILNQIALDTNLIIDFGGGIKSEDSLIQSLRSGATQVNIGSLSVRNSNLVKFWIMRYGAEQIIVGADVKDRKLAISGWLEDTEVHIFDFINGFIDNGAKNFVCTDIDRDGMMMGSSIDLYNDIMDHFPDIQLIASGGVSSIDECKQLEDIGVSGIILGKALYEGLIDPFELQKAFS
jgi:phosphoribosylformimino-5-aminoimidazole carboxamide ribotide isomerase